MDLETILAKLTEELEKFNVKGDLTDEERQEKERLEAEKKRVEDKIDSDPDLSDDDDELAKLRSQLAAHSKRETAKQIATEIFSRSVVQEQKEREELQELVRTELSSLMGGGDIKGVVEGVLRSNRTPSRFVGQAASESYLDKLSNGQETRTVDNSAKPIDHKSRAKLEAKEIRESKNLGKFFGIAAKAHRGEMWLSEGEKEFVRSTLDIKAMAEMTDSAGGFLVPQEWMPDILGLLRAQAVVRQAQPREIPFNKAMNQTSISSGATASYTGENLRITPSELTFAEAPILSPKNLTALVPVSNYLLNDADQADTIIRADLVEVIALKEDVEFLRGTGAAGGPIGLRNKSGITLNPVTVPANGFQPTLADLRRIRATYRNTNQGQVRLAWFFHPSFLAYLETRTDADGRFLLDSNLLQLNDGGLNGTIDGIPFYTSTQIPNTLTQGSATNATDLMLVNLAETYIGMNQDLQIAVSTDASWTSDGTNWNSSFQQSQTLFRAVVRHDIAHRRPQQIVVQTGVLV